MTGQIKHNNRVFIIIDKILLIKLRKNGNVVKFTFNQLEVGCLITDCFLVKNHIVQSWSKRKVVANIVGHLSGLLGGLVMQTTNKCKKIDIKLSQWLYKVHSMFRATKDGNSV